MPADTKPFSDKVAIFIWRLHAYIYIYAQLPDKARQGKLCQLWGVNRNRFHSKFLLLQPSIDRSSYIPILILKRIYSLSSYTLSSFHSSRLIPYGTYYVRDVLYFHPYTGSHSLVPCVHSSCLICMFYGGEHH